MSAAATDPALKPDCLFCRIIRREIPARIVYEDDVMLVFHDIAPSTPVHLLAIPKIHVDSLFDVTDAHAPMLGHLFARFGRIARDNGLGDGFRTIVNNGPAAHQEVHHLHVHLLGGGGRPIPGPMVGR